MEKLRLNITEKIQSGLPMVSRLQCREVCRTWRTSFLKPKKGLLYEISHLKGTDEFEAQIYFSEVNNDKVGTNPVDDNDDLGYLGTLTKLRHGLISPSPSKIQSCIAGSCNGLVCYAGYDNGFKRIVYIRNPLTEEQIQLPTIDEGVRVEKTIGFGYNSSSDEYKVVRLLHNYLRTEGTVQVYSLQEATGWTITTGKIRERVFSQLRYSVSAGIFAGGALHWMDERSIKPNIIAFDLKNENIEKFKLLPSIPSVFHGANHVRLMVLGGNLCVLELVPCKHVTIWEYAQKHRTYARKRPTYARKRRKYVSPWAMKFNIPLEDYSWLEPFGLNKCLLWYNVVLSCYDPETKTLRKLDETLKKHIDDCAAPSLYTTTRATPHVPSLVSLKEFMEERVGKKRKALEET